MAYGKFSQVLTKGFLEEEYIKERLSLGSIARSIGCQSDTVMNYCKKYNIPVRTSKEQIFITNSLNLSVDKLQELYKQGMTLKEIGQIYSCSVSTLKRILNTNGISTKPKKGRLNKRLNG